MGGGTRGWLREGPERRWPGGGGVGGSVGALSIRVVRGKSRITASLGRDASGHLSRLTALWVIWFQFSDTFLFIIISGSVRYE